VSNESLEALEEVNEEVVDVMELVANQSDEDEDIVDDDDLESDGDLPDDLEGLKALLLKEREIKRKRNKSLKKSKQAGHRIQQENENLQKRLDAIESKLNDSSSQSDNKVEAEEHERQVQEWQDRVADDPTQALGYMDWKQKILQDKLANYVGGMEQRILSQLDAMKSATNPDAIEYKSEIEALRQNPQFADMDDNVLLSVAKAFKGTMVKKPRGTIAGKKPRSMKPEEFELTDEERMKMGF